MTIESEISRLMEDEEICNKKGIYAYILTNEEKYLNLRKFSDAQKRTMYERQKGKCEKCGKHFEINEMDGDHIKK
jgi:methionyl-tRNA synthetase